MNILIDGLAIRKKKAGVGVYAKNVIDHLLLIDSGTHYFILAQDDDPDLNFRGRPNVTSILVSARLFRIVPLRLLWEQLVLPFVLLRYRIDAIHSLHYSFPLIRFGTKQVVTLHDMTSFIHPEVHVRAKVWYFRFFIRAAVRYADAIIFVSQSCSDDCRDLVGVPRRLSTVIYHGKSDRCHANIETDAIDAVRSKYGLPVNFIMYIGTIEPRKNLRSLVNAFATLTEQYPALSLVIAGMKGWNNEFTLIQELIRDLGIESQIIFPGFVDESDKPALLAATMIFIYPSLYEGFGLPVLEAMACGVPTITSNTSSLVEVAGDSALLVDPRNHEEMASALAALLSDPALRCKMRNKGIEQAGRFSWEKTAKATLEVYERVVKKNP